jgi:hypothetical protein
VSQPSSAAITAAMRAGQPLQASRSSRARRNTRLTAPGAVHQLALELLQPQPPLLGLEHLVGGTCLQEGHPAGGRQAMFVQGLLDRAHGGLGHRAQALGHVALLGHVRVAAPGRLDLREIPAAIAGAPDPAGLLGLAHGGLADAQCPGEGPVAGAHRPIRLTLA